MLRIAFTLLSIVCLTACGDDVPAPSTAPSPSTVAALAAAAEPVDDTPLTPREIGELFSQRIEALEAKIAACDFIRTTYTAKMKQDVAFSNLDAYRKDSEELKGMLQAQQKALFSVAAAGNYSGDDAEYFDTAYELTDEIITDYVSLAVNVAVEANYGMSDEADTDQTIRELRAAQKKFIQNAVAAYKKFGYRKSEINSPALTIKHDPALQDAKN